MLAQQRRAKSVPACTMLALGLSTACCAIVYGPVLERVFALRASA
jgi:hypothetical protein